jgi:hypothetical protein
MRRASSAHREVHSDEAITGMRSASGDEPAAPSRVGASSVRSARSAGLDSLRLLGGHGRDGSFPSDRDLLR